jgi:hypothetical protein
MNKPINFELAKLLKEKGFDTKVNCAYVDTTPFSEIKNDLTEYVAKQNHNQKEHRYSAPTIAEVVMWLYDKHELWTNVMYMGFELKYSWSVDIITTSGSNWDSYGEEDDIFYNSPTEAYLAAIEYSLNNLI